ncbi:unnamed protein product, partial [Symbiodinium microadriaticum]
VSTAWPSCSCAKRFAVYRGSDSLSSMFATRSCSGAASMQMRLRDSKSRPAGVLPHVAADDSEKDEEWDLNGPRDVMDIIDHKIPFHDVENARFTMPQFAKVSACYIELLKKKSPK